MELLKLHHEHFLSKELRVDGRKFNESRDLLINMDSITSADSSVTVKLGSTTVMCGMKVTLNEDVKSLESVGYRDLIDLRVSLHPLDEDNGERDEITSLVMKTIKENVLFDHKPLISEDEDGEKRYLTLNIELICLNNDGNVFDAFIIAFMAAINWLEFPDISEILDEHLECKPNPLDGTLIEKVKDKKRLNLIKSPISITSVLMKDDTILLDPNRDEERLATGTMTIVFDVKSEKIIIMEKRGGTAIDDVKLLKHLSFTKSMADKLFKTLPFLTREEAMET